MIKEISNKNAKQIRLIAVQIAYAQNMHESFGNHFANHEEILKQHDPENILQAAELISCCKANKKQIDQQIVTYLSEAWPINRLNLVTLSVLRIAVTEIMILGHYTQKLINLYLSIAEILLEKDEVHFINAVISKIALSQSNNHSIETAALPISA